MGFGKCISRYFDVLFVTKLQFASSYFLRGDW